MCKAALIHNTTVQLHSLTHVQSSIDTLMCRTADNVHRYQRHLRQYQQGPSRARQALPVCSQAGIQSVSRAHRHNDCFLVSVWLKGSKGRPTIGKLAKATHRQCYTFQRCSCHRTGSAEMRLCDLLVSLLVLGHFALYSKLL